MTIQEIAEAATAVLKMLTHYKGVAGQGELGVDRVLYGFLAGRFGRITRQHLVTHGRIDYRYGTSNPVVIELVVRSPHDARARLFPSQNLGELRKLTRIRRSTARTRVLLLLDRSRDQITRPELQRQYRRTHAGRGRFQRHPVRVIYVHAEVSYNFRWTPYRV